MRSLFLAAALVAACLFATAEARADPPFLTSDAARAAVVLEMTRAAVAWPGDAAAAALGTNATTRALESMPRLGARGAAHGLYLWGDDAFHLVPRRLGVWGWGLMAGGTF